MPSVRSTIHRRLRAVRSVVQMIKTVARRKMKGAAALLTVTAMACAPPSGSGTASEDASRTVAVERVRHTVDSDGHPMAVWEKSTPEPRAVILLVHGRTWSTVPDFDLQLAGEELSLMDGLVALDFATYGVDLRGYGATPRDESGWNTPHRAAADVASTLAWIRARHPHLPVHLFGWSLGSMVSKLTAQRNPQLIDRPVLFGYPHRSGRKVATEEPDGAPPMAPTTAEAAASDFIVPGSISQGAIEAYVAAALEWDPVRSDWTAGHQWNEPDPAAVTVPTLIPRGEHDPLSPPEGVPALFTRLGTTDKALVVIPGGDQAAFLETPRPYFLSALRSFLLR